MTPRQREAVEEAVGPQWDVVRISTPLAATVVDRCRSQGIRLGPVLDVPARRTYEFLVPPGTARCWPPLPSTRCVDRGTIRLPHPTATHDAERAAPCGRRWIIPPATSRPLTDPDRLYEAIAAALIHRAARTLTPQGGYLL